MTDYLLVDGYNIINDWENLKKTAADNLEHARVDLIEELSKFKGVLWKDIILVFDAHLAEGSKRNSERLDGILVIYTQEGETADSLIESLVYELVSQDEQVEVATSDWQEQRLILGKGATRLSARELNNLLGEVKQKLRKEYMGNREGKNTLGNLLEKSVQEKLDKLRQED